MTPSTIEDLLSGRPLIAVTGSLTVAAACHRMREHGVGALAVLDDAKLVGILSERDIAVRVIAGHRDPMLTLVREVMTREPRIIPAHTDIAAAIRTMLEGGFRHLPVTRGGRILGMLSMRDISHAGQGTGDAVKRKGMPVLALG